MSEQDWNRESYLDLTFPKKEDRSWADLTLCRLLLTVSQAVSPELEEECPRIRKGFFLDLADWAMKRAEEIDNDPPLALSVVRSED